MKCVVIGGGTIGSRKAMTLAKAGAHVTVISPVVTDELKDQLREPDMKWIESEFGEEHLEGAFLVVAATPDKGLNTTVARLARERKALVCDASSAEGSQVIFGALLDADESVVAVFTDGRDPAKARRERDEIAALLSSDRNDGK
ncbi:MAG: bifunctional precorrin-2 dehydrogenase/sirohydrochlorin ferrochelatase [Gemmatimonadota bacterium]|nr:MAG: bifunctional precorrin-2 dehydrogenase/sirohydrochlorin ferrochelatase [Gemmatimonadota bacterium]